MTNQLADLIQRYYDAFNRKDLAIYDRLFTPDCLIEAPGVQLTGIEGARGFDRVWQNAMPDSKIISLHKTAGDQLVMCENRLRGTHTGPLMTAEGTLPPSGKRFDEAYMAVFELEGERIKRQTLHFDRLQIMNVIGPADSSAANIKTVASIYEAFGRQDLPHILAQLADDVSWGIDSSADVPPYGVLQGKQNVPKFFAAWGEIGEFTRFEASDFVATADQVFNTLHHEFKMKSGKTVKQSSLQHWTLAGGKITRWRGYEDTAATRDAYAR